MRVEAVLRLERDHAVSKDWPNDICVNCCGKIIYKIAQVLDGQSDYASLFDTANDYQVKKVESNE
ncbi:hypothetical protein KAR91_04600 [Candidatus Pacearchaeota archaeon]|nr:hypothetical protein [Candidatus Pacearchaeota archaeon]